MSHPVIIQGGMGIGVSGWKLARAVSKEGQLGVVSGTALPHVFVRRLQLGDPEGHYRRALEQFPVQELAQKVLDRFYIPGGKSESVSFADISPFTIKPCLFLQQLTTMANFAEVYLAKEGHDGVVGINYLEKVQLPNLASFYGAMLAGVNYVLMGAGIPREIPGYLDQLARHELTNLRLSVAGADPSELYMAQFDPKWIDPAPEKQLQRPYFLAIVSSATLAITLAKKSTGKVDGFVVERHTAGGHNAPPRGRGPLSANGEPIYGERDEADLKKISELGLPFWLAGSYGSPEKLREAHAQGATGVQVGTAFAFCDESGLDERYRRKLIEKVIRGDAGVYTDPLASPTGFPFKVALLEESLSEHEVYHERPRICDMGYLRTAYKRDDGSLGYRCPAEPVEAFVAKGGTTEETIGRKCLCNALMANIGLPQQRKNGSGYLEKPLVTLGNDLNRIRCFIPHGAKSYSAKDVVHHLLNG